MRVERKVVLITGASEGIGAACVRAFRERGARVAAVARSADKLRGDLTFAGDLTDPAVRELAVARTVEGLGRIDVLVNCAGVGLYVPSHEAADADTRRLFELNFFAPLHLGQLAAVHMKRQRSGAIVNVSSVAGKVTLPWLTLYSASKHALNSLTEGLRTELRRYGIHCMTVCPGYVRTNFQNNIIAGTVPPAVGGALQQRWAIAPQRCAEAILRGLERDSPTVLTPWSSWFLVAAHALLPGIVERKFEQMYLSGGKAN